MKVPNVTIQNAILISDFSLLKLKKSFNFILMGLLLELSTLALTYERRKIFEIFGFANTPFFTTET